MKSRKYYIDAWEEMKHHIHTQDNDSTAEPIFIVQQRQRIYGFDHDYSDNTVWLDGWNDCAEIEGDKKNKLEEEYQKTLTVPDGYYRTCYLDQWEFVQPFFTRVGAERFIESNRHNLTNPRIYVDSGHRNHEWKSIRFMLREEVIS